MLSDHGERMTSWALTVKEALDLQVADAEAEHGQLVQPSPDLLGEGQQAGELVQLAVQAVAVAFGRVGLGAIGRWRFGAVDADTKKMLATKRTAFPERGHDENKQTNRRLNVR